MSVATKDNIECIELYSCMFVSMVYMHTPSVCALCVYTFTICGQKAVGLACLIKEQMAMQVYF